MAPLSSFSPSKHIERFPLMPTTLPPAAELPASELKQSEALNFWSPEAKSMREKCGVLGVVMPPAVSDEWQAMGQWLYYGLYALQHRGQESCGMAVFDHEQLRLHRDMGLVNQVFDATTLANMVGQIGVGHTRYSTTGSSDVGNAQPLVVRTNNGPLVIAHNGNLVNTDELQAQLDDAVRPAHGCSDTLVMAEHIRAELAKVAFPKIADLVDVLQRLLPTFKGAFSLVIAFGNCLIAARDPVGFRPLCLGQTKQGAWVAASETSALDILGAEWDSDVAPGEFVVIRQDGAMLRERYATEKLAEKFCFFELVYFSRPDSRVRDGLVYEYRMALGDQLAKRSSNECPEAIEADVVIPVPDSGNVAAVGYSQASGIPYMEGLIKNRYVGRTFIHPTQALRERSIQLKLNPMAKLLKGKRIVVVDDSIVRGNTSKKLVAMLRQCGVKEIHLRISSAPVKHPCFYGIDMSTPDQLIANKMTTQQIADWLGVDSLIYLDEADMVAAAASVGTHKPFCFACFTGDYPTELPPDARVAIDDARPSPHQAVTV